VLSAACDPNCLNGCDVQLAGKCDGTCAAGYAYNPSTFMCDGMYYTALCTNSKRQMIREGLGRKKDLSVNYSSVARIWCEEGHETIRANSAIKG